MASYKVALKPCSPRALFSASIGSRPPLAPNALRLLTARCLLLAAGWFSPRLQRRLPSVFCLLTPDPWRAVASAKAADPRGAPWLRQRRSDGGCSPSLRAFPEPCRRMPYALRIFFLDIPSKIPYSGPTGTESALKSPGTRIRPQRFSSIEFWRRLRAARGLNSLARRERSTDGHSEWLRLVP
jgi:hypothetical protein